MKLALLLAFSAMSAAAQTNLVTSTNGLAAVSNVPAVALESGANSSSPYSARQFAAAQAASIEGRRHVCGKILQILPEGVVVDSGGYTNILDYPSWLIPQAVTANRATSLLEENHPDGLCAGLVFVTDLPKSSRAKPKLYDYVNVTAFPAGQFTYTSVGDLRRTVRKFSVQIEKAIQWRLADGEKQGAPKQ